MTTATATAPRNISLDVHMWLQSQFPDVRWGVARQIHVLVPPQANAAAISVAVGKAYPQWSDLGCPDFTGLIRAVTPSNQARSTRATRAATAQVRADNAARLARLKQTFTQDYVGLAAIRGQFKDYVLKCWNEFLKNRTTRKFPYISIVQSSGFGKTRLLYELARAEAPTTDAVTSASAQNLAVLYVCLQEEEETGFPLPTPHMRQWLFPTKNPLNIDDDLTDGLADRLFGVFEYASTHWGQVGKDWLELFLDNTTDEIERDKIKAHKSTSLGSRQQFTSPQNSRVVVLAIDEASYLLKRSAIDQLGWFRRLRRALNQVSTRIAAAYGDHAGIFAILVDTNSKISDFVPPASCDSSARTVTVGGSMLPPPFIFTQTMDIKYEQRVKHAESSEGKDREAFMQSNLELPEKSTREVLASMGRPMWSPLKPSDLVNDATWTSLLDLAAYKLLQGSSSSSLASFNDHSLNGVGSLLCRVGIWPYAWSPLACRAVADAMAILVHMSHTNEQLVTTSSSEPILAFGAARVWHQAEGAFQTKILPQLRRLLHQEVVDTGGIGELVARILLLLAMDATGVIQEGVEDKRCYAGELYRVPDFLRALHGESPTMETASGNVFNITPDSFLNDWNDWQLGFSHFIQLHKAPTKEILWAMLERRAACTLPRGFKGVDLVIPIFRKGTAPGDPSEVSMMLVQVKNRQDGDASFPDSAVIATRPSVAFSGKKDIEDPKNDVVRIYMSLGGAEKVERFYILDPGVRKSPRNHPGSLAAKRSPDSGSEDDEPPKKRPKTGKSTAVAPAVVIGKAASPLTRAIPKPFVLCIMGVGEYKAVNKNDRSTISVLTQGVAKELKDLLEPWWKIEALVKEDIKERTDLFGLYEEAMLATATRPLAETLLSGAYPAVPAAPQPATPQIATRLPSTSGP